MNKWSYVKFSDKLNVTFFAIILPASDRISPFDPDIFFRTDPETDWCYIKFSDKLNATFLTIIQPSAALISPFDPGIFSRTDPETDIHNDCVRGWYCKTC